MISKRTAWRWTACLLLSAGVGACVEPGGITKGEIAEQISSASDSSERATIVAADARVAIEAAFSVRRVLAEAGLAATLPGFARLLRVESNPLGLDTGLAMANPTGNDASVLLSLIDSENEVVDSVVTEIPAHQQVARFVRQLFDLGEAPFSGTLEIQSSTSISVVSLRTQNGLQLSSLP